LLGRNELRNQQRRELSRPDDKLHENVQQELSEANQREIEAGQKFSSKVPMERPRRASAGVADAGTAAPNKWPRAPTRLTFDG